MPKKQFNYTLEDYLRAVYRIEEREGVVQNAELSRELDLSPAAISEMIKKLADLRLVRYQKYHGSTLTEKGKKEAIAITRRHRLWEVFLITHLDFGWDQVHELADQLEHIRSDDLIDRLDDFLGNPNHDPHGDPIPRKDGTIVLRDLVAISLMSPTQKGIVRRVSDDYPELLRYAASLGLEIGTEIEVIERITFDNSVRLKAGSTNPVISEKLAASLFAEIS